MVRVVLWEIVKRSTSLLCVLPASSLSLPPVLYRTYFYLRSTLSPKTGPHCVNSELRLIIIIIIIIIIIHCDNISQISIALLGFDFRGVDRFRVGQSYGYCKLHVIQKTIMKYLTMNLVAKALIASKGSMFLTPKIGTFPVLHWS